MSSQSSITQNLDHDIRKGRKSKFDSLRHVLDYACGKVDFQFVFGVDPVGVADEDGEADVDGVSEEDSCEGLGKDCAYAGDFDYRWGVFAAGAEAEVASADYEVAFPDFVRELGIGVFEDVFGEFREVGPEVEEAAGGDVVRADVVSEFPGFTFKVVLHFFWHLEHLPGVGDFAFYG